MDSIKKERIFYLDFIRALSTLLIILTHYNALFIYNVNRPSVAVHIEGRKHLYRRIGCFLLLNNFWCGYDVVAKIQRKAKDEVD